MPPKISARLLLFAALAIAATFAPSPSFSAQLSSETIRAFDQYVIAKEARGGDDFAAKQGLLYIEGWSREQKARAYNKLKAGQILVQQGEKCTIPPRTAVPGGLIHDWVGIVFIPGISITQALATLQNYNRDCDYYHSEVVRSKLLARSGDDFHIYLRLKQVHIITVVLDTQYDVHYERIDRDHEVAYSRSTAIDEVAHAGTLYETDEPASQPGDKDHGFLWRLNSYWSFYQADGGVYIQCNAVSLTRDVPTGLGWLIGSFIETIPESSLRSMLAETRAALLQQSDRTKEKTQ